METTKLFTSAGLQLEALVQPQGLFPIVRDAVHSLTHPFDDDEIIITKSRGPIHAAGRAFLFPQCVQLWTFLVHSLSPVGKVYLKFRPLRLF